MIRKFLKWIGIVLGSLIGLLVVAFVVLYVIGTIQWNRIRGSIYDVQVETLSIPSDQTSIARGEHIATIRGCKHCHTETLGGQFETAPGLITLSFPNLTAGAGGVGNTNTDEDWVRAIRHGVGHDGRGLALMPSRVFYSLNDEDLGSLVAAIGFPISAAIGAAGNYGLSAMVFGLLLGAGLGALPGAVLVWLLRQSPSSDVEGLAAAH